MAEGELPRFVKDLLSTPPTHGEGVHVWMYSVSRYLHALRTEQEIEEILRARLLGCGRNIPARELRSAIKDSKAKAWVPGQKNEIIHQSIWPKLNLQKYGLIVAEGLGAYDLWENSPIRFTDDKTYSKLIIEYLFPGNPFLCCGYSNTVFASKRKVEWMNGEDELDKQQFIVPSACKAETGVTKEGRASAHCLDNVGPRQYLVIEQDTGEADQQCAVLVHLAKHLPLRLVVFSGGRSYHGWFDCIDRPESTQLKFMREATSLGCDPATWSKSQFVRMPDGLREDGKRQSTFYFNPKQSE